MTEAPVTARSFTNSVWFKWSWLLVLAFIIVLSLDYHWRRLPTTASGYFARGRADYLLGEYESAIGNFTRSISVDSRYAESYIWRGEAYAKLGELTLAMPDLEKALVLRPDYAKSHAAMADGKAAAWDTEGAIAEYSRAIELEPDYGRCYLERGKMLYDSGRWKEAADDLRAASSMEINERRITSQLFLWVARARSGDAAGATDELSRVASIGVFKSNRFWNASHFLSGGIAEAAYLDAATSPNSDGDERDLVEGYFLAGTKRLLAGDPVGALPLLRRVLAADAEESYAYERTRAELSRLLAGLQVRVAPGKGLTVVSVTPDGPAATAGITPGSVIASIAGQEAGQEAFISWLSTAEPGTVVALGVAEGAAKRTDVSMTVRLGSSVPTR